MTDFTIKQTRFRDTPGVRAVREEVFIQEQNVPAELEWDGHDDEAIQIIACNADKQIIGTARMLPDGHIGRMAVIKLWRRQGVGTALLTTLIEIARQVKLSRVFLHAQTSAVEFYLHHGFVIKGDEFMDAGIPHYYMDKVLD